MGVDLKVLYMSVDAQDVAGGGQLVALVTAGLAAIERRASWPGRRWSMSRARMRKDLGVSLAQIAQGNGVSESLVRRVLKVEDVEALPATAFKES